MGFHLPCLGTFVILKMVLKQARTVSGTFSWVFLMLKSLHYLLIHNLIRESQEMLFLMVLDSSHGLSGALSIWVDT